MKFSLITPTHKVTPFLTELYESIVAQTHTDWEWVIWLNGAAERSDLPIEIKNNSKVKIFKFTGENNSVGFHKNQAFHLGTGDILVEVDHDDILIETCLEKLNVAFQDSSVGFVYTDNLTYHMEDKFVPFNAANGWTYDKHMWRGKELIRMHSFAPSSRSLAFIWYAPDHVRAWRANVYKEVGGHNPELEVCDDHELMIRTYLKTKFLHVPEPLYVYRITGDNTWLERNAKIQKMTVDLFNKYAVKLAERDAELRGLKKVDIGGGLFPKPLYLTIDQEGADINCDLNDGIPLPDNSVGVLNASHLVEHLKDPVKTMREIHRVLADGGWAFIEVPSTDGRGAWQDPTHVSFWNENSFWYYTRKDKAQFIRNKTIRFQSFRLDTVWWEDKIAITNAWLCAIKSDDRRPHLVNI
jgi:glycosyltransferase involved in cell wall biosynthesis